MEEVTVMEYQEEDPIRQGDLLHAHLMDQDLILMEDLVLQDHKETLQDLRVHQDHKELQDHQDRLRVQVLDLQGQIVDQVLDHHRVLVHVHHLRQEEVVLLDLLDLQEEAQEVEEEEDKIPYFIN